MCQSCKNTARNGISFCLDDVHKCWVVVEAENNEQARNMLPTVYRNQAVIVGLNKFTLEEMDEIIRHHKN